MKSSYPIAMVLVLSLLLGLSFGQLHQQEKEIQTLREQLARKTAKTDRARISHAKCYQMMRQQRIRYEVARYHRALRELGQAAIFESDARRVSGRAKPCALSLSSGAPRQR